MYKESWTHILYGRPIKMLESRVHINRVQAQESAQLLILVHV